MSADFEDWTRGLELVVDDMSDFPDWTVAAQVTGGGSGGYASLTGPGQTVTPGKLTQEGDFEVDTTGAVTFDCGGISATTNVGTFTTGLPGWSFTTNPGFTFNTDSLVSTSGAGLFYGTAGAGPTSGENIIIKDEGSGAQVDIFVFHGNPNGHITPGAGVAGFCIDTATPKLWGWAQGAASWVTV